MSEALNNAWIAAVAASGGPLALLGVTGCLVLVTLASLATRNPRTRDHHLRLLRQLTRFTAVLLRGGRR